LIAGEVFNRGVLAITVHIRKTCGHHSIQNPNSKVSREELSRNIEVVYIHSCYRSCKSKSVGLTCKARHVTKSFCNGLIFQFNFISLLLARAF
jgi:hypothetical protein